MVPQQWYAIYPARRVGKKPVGLTRLGQKIVLWRDGDGRLVCMPDRCCHRAAQLSCGRVVDGCIECPYHGMRYDGDGAVVKIPALGTRPIPRVFHLGPLPCREERGLVWLWHGDARADLPPIPWDDALDAELAPGRHAVDIEDQFDINYLRLMENSTDLFHVPFVHRRTIPVGEVLEDFECTSDGVHVRVSGRMTDGKSRGLVAAVHVVVPSLLIITAGKVRFLAIATPIDEHNTWVFARYVQDYVRLPLIGGFLSWLLGVFDYRLLQRYQDAPVWRTQQLDDPGDVGHYQLLVGDGGVACYFRIRHRLLQEAQHTDGDERDDREGPASNRSHRSEPLRSAVAP